VQHLFLDAVFEPLRRTGAVKDGVPVAWGILTHGRRVLLQVAMGSTEGRESWLEFLRDMIRRGLGVPLSITTDGAPGLMGPVEEMGPKKLRIRRWAHQSRNVLDKMPEDLQAETKTYRAVGA
jgi:putative transposase